MHGIGLRYFVEVASSGSLSAASARLHVAVSAISRQIGKLESEVGTPLFDRYARGMTLSAAGEMLLVHARRSLIEADAVLADIAAQRNQGGTLIRIACTEGFTRYFMSNVICDFLGKVPGTRFSVHVDRPDEVSEKVKNGEADLGLVFTMLADSTLEILYAASAPIYATVPRGHALAGRQSLSLEDLLAHPLVLPSAGNTVRQLFDSCCALIHRKVEPLLDSNNSSAMQGVALRAGALTLGSRLNAPGQGHDPEFEVIPIAHELMRNRMVQLQAMPGRTFNAATTAFVAALTQALEVGGEPLM